MRMDRRIVAAAAAAILTITGISGCGAEGNNGGNAVSTSTAESTAAAETGSTTAGGGANSSDTALSGNPADTAAEETDSGETQSTDNTASQSESETPSYTYHLKMTPQYDSAVSDKDSSLLATSTYYLLSLQEDANSDVSGAGAGSATQEKTESAESYSAKADSAIQKALDEVNADSKEESGTFAEDNKKDAQEWRDMMTSTMDASDSAEDSSADGTGSSDANSGSSDGATADTFTGHYEDENNLSVERADSRCLSILRSHYQFLGGAHGMTVTEAYNFDAQTGKKLELSDVLSSTDNLASILYHEVKKQSSPDQAAGLEEDAESTIEKMVSDDSITWYVGGDGIHFVFDAYDIGPYAAGPYSAVLTPEDYSDIVNSHYTESPESYVTDTALYMGTSVDGKDLVVTPDYDVNNDIGKLTVTYGDKSVSFDYHAFSVDCDVIHTPKDNYLYLNGHSENDWESITVVDLSEDQLIARNCDEGIYDAVLTDPDNMILSTRTQLMSTAQISKSFRAGEHGVPESTSDFWMISGMSDHPLTLKEDAELNVLKSLDSDSTQKEKFAKGTEFTLYRTDNESVVDAVTKDGEYVRFTVDSSSWPQKIDGQYNLEDLLDGTFFAG